MSPGRRRARGDLGGDLWFHGTVDPRYDLDDLDTDERHATLRRARLATLVSVIGFVLCDLVGVMAHSEHDWMFVTGAFGGSAFFLAMLAAAVWWAYLRSQERSRALDARLDAELAGEQIDAVAPPRRDMGVRR